MQKTDHVYQAYCEVLRRELTAASGCTEPIALAYCAAKARQTLGRMPERVRVQVSGNIIKNVKSVTVPNTGGLRGIPAAVAAGIVAGDAERALEVIRDVSEEQQRAIRRMLDTCPIEVEFLPSDDLLDMIVMVQGGGHEAMTRVRHTHTNIARIEKDGQVLEDHMEAAQSGGTQDENLLTIQQICEFAACVELDDVREPLERQLQYNMAIARRGLKESYGAQVGQTLLSVYGNGVRNRAKAMAAAGSDARMSGCELPVVINSGSGNQGLTVSVPVAVYAEEYHKTQEELYRALVVSNLTAIHQKTTIGKLSAFCGAVTAGAGAGAGIAWLLTQDFSTVAHTIVNALAIVSGIICDGAKASCAAKIASAVDAGIMGFEMYRLNRQFYGGDGIVAKGVENTIRNVGLLGHDGMRATDEMILKIMIHHT